MYRAPPSIGMTVGSGSPSKKREKGECMQVFIKYQVQETITDREEVVNIRQVASGQRQQIIESGKVRASGIF
jgi:hypothetical protein